MKTSFLTKGGIFTAASFIFIYLSTIIPNNRLFLLGVASAIIPLAVISTNVKNSILIYIATSLLTFLLIGPKGQVIAYIVFFGTYGLIKFYIEKLNKLYLELILKFLFFNLCVLISVFIYKSLFIPIKVDKIPMELIFLGLQIIFFIYDYAITLFIDYMRRRFVK